MTTTAGSCADRTVTVAVTDNGAMNGADNHRRVDTVSATLVVNCAPTADGQSVSTAEDTAKSITLGATDPDGDALTYTVVDGDRPTARSPGYGRRRAPTSRRRTSTAPDSFTFRVTDVHGRQSDTATVVRHRHRGQRPPVATDAARSTDEDTSLVIDLSRSRATSTATRCTVSPCRTGPANGGAVVTGPLQITYTRTATSTASTRSSTRSTTATAARTPASSRSTVDPVDDPPVAADQTVTTPEETPITVTLGPTVDDDGERSRTPSRRRPPTWHASVAAPTRRPTPRRRTSTAPTRSCSRPATATAA